MWYCKCPICRTEYDHNPKVCSCGFEGLLAKEGFTPRNDEAAKEQEELFSIFKFAKHVLYGKIPYRPTHIYQEKFEDHTLVDAATELRALAVVDCVGDPPTITHDGLFAFDRSVRALILNTNTASRLMLDEASISILLLGQDFGGFEDGVLRTFRPLRYLTVHGDNPHLSSEDNVLFDKNQTRLIAYAALKPEKEYTVPATVKVLTKCSFHCPRYLKKLLLPKGVRLERNALCFATDAPVEVVYY